MLKLKKSAEERKKPSEQKPIKNTHTRICTERNEMRDESKAFVEIFTCICYCNQCLKLYSSPETIYSKRKKSVQLEETTKPNRQHAVFNMFSN